MGGELVLGGVRGGGLVGGRAWVRVKVRVVRVGTPHTHALKHI